MLHSKGAQSAYLECHTSRVVHAQCEHTWQGQAGKRRWRPALENIHVMQDKHVRVDAHLFHATRIRLDAVG